MRIAIFGGGGFIGRALQEKAQGRHEVFAFSHADYDIGRPATFASKLAAAKPDAVINLAAILGTLKESPSIRDIYAVNVMGNLNILAAAYAAGARNYIFSSSIVVHGENKIGEHQKRTSLFNPKHGYAASKAAAEYSMQQYLREAPEIKIAAVRPANVLGQGTVLPHAPIEFIKTALAGKPIEIYGEGRHEREWVWVDDAAEGILAALDYAGKAAPGYYPFFLSAARISMRDLAEKVAGKLGGKVIYAPSTAQAFTLTSEMEESQKILGWRPQVDMDGMVERLTAILRSPA